MVSTTGGTVIFLLFVGTWIGLGVIIGHAQNRSIVNEAKEAIQQCEADLPRHQHCKVVISAEVE